MHSIRNYLVNPVVALSSFVLWVLIFITILGSMGAFSTKFTHFGPSTDQEMAIVFLGTHINSWYKVITLYVLGFFSSMISTYSSTVYNNWKTNTVGDQKTKELKLKKWLSHLLVIIAPIVYNINGILELFITLTLQLQFLLPQLLGNIIASIYISNSYLATKKFKK